MQATSNVRVLDMARSASGQSDADLLGKHRQSVARAILKRHLDQPAQRAILDAMIAEKNVAILGNRRGGKSSVVGDFVLARCIARDDFVCRIITHRLAAPSKAWLAREKDGALALLEQYDMLQYANVGRSMRSVVEITFAWGSAIHVLDVGTEAALHAKRGVTADIWWGDEAQHIELLSTATTELIIPTLADRDGTLVLSGTPGRDVDSPFYTYAHVGGGWASMRCYAWQNPAFGPTFEERWRKLVDQILVPARTDYGLSDEDLAMFATLTEDRLLAVTQGEAGPLLDKWVATLDPRLRREFFGLWLASGDDYVTSWHDAPEHKHWARVAKSPLDLPEALPVVPDSVTERLFHLPHLPTGARAPWVSCMGLDLGWSTSATAWVVLVWSRAFPGRVFELYSRAAHYLGDDEILDHTAELVTDLRGAGVPVVGVRADLNGMRVNTHQTWSSDFSSRFANQVPIQFADKAYTESQYRALNSDMMRGTFHLIAGGVLDIECRYLRWRPKKQTADREIHKFRMVTLPDGTRIRPGDHAIDATRYARPLCPYTKPIPKDPHGEESLFDRRMRLQDEQEYQ